MSEEGKCGELRRLYRANTLDKPFPEDFVAHAAFCETCLFWISHTLAIKKAVVETKRIKFEDCPEFQNFQALLILAARSIKTHPLISRKTARGIQHVSSPELSPLINLWIHINECDVCKPYCDELYDKMTEFQKSYETLVKNRGEVRGIIDRAPEETIVPKCIFSRISGEEKPN